jgi:23S rRNA pseudouridine2605 synthase
MYQYKYFAFYKPCKTISSLKHINRYVTIKDYVESIESFNLHVVGRLDYNVSGLILLTNDGKLTNKLTHPYFKIEKIYLVKVHGSPSTLSILNLCNQNKNIIKIINIGNTKQKNTWLKVTLRAGKHREIINTFWGLNTPVLKMIRINFANVSVYNLLLGHIRKLSLTEIIGLYIQGI